MLPVLLVLEYWRHDEFGFPVRYDALVLRVVVALALGVVVGRLVDMERGQAHDADERAAEAERLRDELGRRVDLLEATSRAARALGSSLDLDRPSPRSCGSCAACCRSTGPRSCSRKQAERA